MRSVALCGALFALALTCPPAVAQLPQPPLGGAVGEIPQEPLPQPVEEVVQSSPVAPVREEVRRAVDEVSGEAGIAGGSQPAPAAPTQQGPTPSSAAGPGSSGRAPGGTKDPGGSRRDRGARSGGRETATDEGAGSGTVVTGAARPGEFGDASSTFASSGDGGNPVTRAIDRVVAVVPTFVWIALGVLFLIAAGLGARTFAERRRARALEADREQLRREVELLERALLPPVPERLGALAASVAYRPAEGPAAGGDFYDAFELPGGRAALLVGDVSGHGPDALERTNAIRAGLHACLEAGLSPRAALDSVARRAESDNGDFATVAVAVHDPAAGTLAYATAGHPAPILTGPSAHDPITAACAPPIGIGLRTGTRGTTVPLPAGSVACFFTDGLLEAHVGDELLGRERLAEIVAALEPGDGAAAVLDSVIAAADSADDDMAVFVVRPVAGAEIDGARVEELELAPEELEQETAERFLEACGVRAEDAAAAMEQVRTTLATAGGAVIQATVEPAGATVRVSPAPDTVGPSAPV